MREINLIVVHCTATPVGRDCSVADIRAWHLARGFSDVGYHYVVRIDGTIETGRPLEKVGAHARGYNANSVGVAYVGGLDAAGKPADTRTPAQRKALKALLAKLRGRFSGARIIGHRDVAAKACPCFDATSEYAAL
ncbi:MAG: N-acetylmuramoyl-L-alanine amidase [Muribaculaceae bacterium]|nr:N-acetylmuramoyl-L-alanine amidase [Muribaculaceae bacterium]